MRNVADLPLPLLIALAGAPVGLFTAADLLLSEVLRVGLPLLETPLLLFSLTYQLTLQRMDPAGPV